VLTPFKDPKLGYFHSKGYTRNGVRHWTNTYYLLFNYRGKHDLAVGTADQDEARKIGRKLRAGIVGKIERHEPIGQEANKIKTAHLKELRIKYVTDNCPRNLCRTEQIWNHLLNKEDGFGEWKAKDISALDLDRYTTTRKEQGAASESIRKEMTDLKHSFKLAVQKRLLSSFFVPVFPKLAGSKARQGFFRESEVRSVLEHIKDKVIGWVVLFGSLTGWRKSEILSRKWSDVDFQAGEIRLNTSKNGEGRIFPFLLLPELKELMAELRRYTKEAEQRTGQIIPWVFHHEGVPIQSFRKSWETAVRKAGLPGRLFHDFRRSAVRNLVRAGVPAKIAMELTGHKTRSIFERYNITEESEDLANAVARLAEYRDKQKEATAKEPEKVVAGNFGS
jgi:integrase